MVEVDENGNERDGRRNNVSCIDFFINPNCCIFILATFVIDSSTQCQCLTDSAMTIISPEPTLVGVREPSLTGGDGSTGVNKGMPKATPLKSRFQDLRGGLNIWTPSSDDMTAEYMSSQECVSFDRVHDGQVVNSTQFL
jgi:hypothetical protein